MIRQDLSDKYFNEWYVIKYEGNGKYLCRCSCGELKSVSAYSLKSGASKSCGHASKNKFKDLSNIDIGDLHIIQYVSDVQKWQCICKCRTLLYKSTYEINCGFTKCNCKKSNKLVNLKDKQFGEWKVLEYNNDGTWMCKCSCGTVRNVNSYSLTSGTSTSCGCKNKVLIDLKDKRFGKLKVVKYNKPYWECKCECGNVVNVLSHNLKNGSAVSCGCSKILFTKEELLNKIVYFEEHFNEKPFIYDLATIFNVHDSTIRRYIKNYCLEQYINHSFKSRYEKEIVELLGIDKCETNNRKVLKGNELDIYISSKNVAIEVNGDYWHSSIFKESNYHQQKTLDCAKQGIRLIHIFEHEWLDERKHLILEDILKRAVIDNYATNIYARKTSIMSISSDEANHFLDKYHLQGGCRCSIAYGLVYNDEIISVMTFGKPRFSDSYEYELIRYCNKSKVNIIGGAEKLFHAFLVDTKASSVLTYSDISKFTGNIYTKLGFKPTNNCITTPGYVWVSYGKNEVLSRYRTQLSNLENFKQLGDTEDEIMSALGYYKVYNSGNIRLEWKNEIYS